MNVLADSNIIYLYKQKCMKQNMQISYIIAM